jgi:hypothetical protein
MKKKHEQELADQEALRLSGVFHTPFPAQPPEQEKPMDKVKPPPPKSRTWERER